MPLAGRPMLAWSLEAFAGCEAVEAVVIAVPPGDRPDIRLVGAADRPPVVVTGGATRAESVSIALAEVEAGIVAIHDAARPLVTNALIEALVADLDAAPDADGVIAAKPVVDTLKRAASGSMRQLAFPGSTNRRMVGETIDRSTLWAAQTPQVFRTEALRRALEVDAAVRDAATDESMLVEAAGGTVVLHEVTAPNPKVTTPEDLKLAELLLAERG